MRLPLFWTYKLSADGLDIEEMTAKHSETINSAGGSVNDFRVPVGILVHSDGVIQCRQMMDSLPPS